MPAPTIETLIPTSATETSQSLDALAQSTQTLLNTVARFRSDLREGVEGLERAVARLGSALESIEASRVRSRVHSAR